LPELSVDDPPAVTEGGMISFTVSLSFAPATTVTVDYTTTDGSAASMPGFEDYFATSGTLSFAPGVDTQTVTVFTAADGEGSEGPETFTLNLTNPSGATILDGSGTGTINDASALFATSAASADGRQVEPLRIEQLNAVAQSAIEYWQDALDTSFDFNNVVFAIADLSGLTLATSSLYVIALDVDAAGFGWYVDATPDDNSEFIYKRRTGEYEARPHGPADGRMDLLTVLIHELGHVLGFEHSEHSHDVMSPTLDAGVRRLSVTPMRGTGYSQDVQWLDHVFRRASVSRDLVLF
jgi:hypothetical protein